MNKFFKAAVSAVSAAALVISGMPAGLGAPVLSTQAVDTNNDDWLHAEGSRLYDMNGNEVWLTGANWFGLNCSERCPHYLWSADCDDLLREVADRGINVIRFPVSTLTRKESDASGFRAADFRQPTILRRIRSVRTDLSPRQEPTAASIRNSLRLTVKLT